MKAIVNGAIPITSKLVPSNLEILTRGFDMGPTTALTINDTYDEITFETWMKSHW